MTEVVYKIRECIKFMMLLASKYLKHREIQCCDKAMDYEAVKKKWDSWLSENLANLQGNFRSKSFLDVYVDYNSFCSKKKLDQYNTR